MKPVPIPFKTVKCSPSRGTERRATSGNARLMKGYATLSSMRVRAAIHVSDAKNAEAKLDMTSGLASCLSRKKQAAMDSDGHWAGSIEMPFQSQLTIGRQDDGEKNIDGAHKATSSFRLTRIVNSYKP